ncbi:hypothetical protein IKF04_02060 [Candidatus Saccharibacteria bacterium]|nr:hypothetical protein [Candidatus Saccharibacteria bacterium]
MNEKKSAITPAQAADELYRALLALNEERAVCYLEILKNLRCQIMIGDVLNSFFNSLVGEYIREIPTQGNAIITLANKRAEKLGLSSEKTNDFLLAIAKASDEIAENLPFALPITCIKGEVRFRDGMEFTVHFDPEEEIKSNRYIILGKKNAQIGLFLNVYYRTLERENITGYHTICGFNHGYFSEITKELPCGCFIPTIEQIERYGLEKDPGRYLKYTEKFCDCTGRYLMTSTVIHQKECDKRIYGTSHICLGKHSIFDKKPNRTTSQIKQFNSVIEETEYELRYGKTAKEGIFIFPICFTMDYLEEIEGKLKDKKSGRVKKHKKRNSERRKS